MGVMGEVVKALGRDLPYPSGTAIEFNSLVRHMLIGRGDPSMAHLSAEGDPGTPRKVVEILKAAVTAGSLADPTWAGNLAGYRQVIAAYVESLSSISFFDRALTDGAFVRVPPRTPIAVVTVAAVASTIAELAPKPVSSMTLTAPSVDLQKAVATVVVTNEIVQTPGTVGLIGRELQRSVAKATDTTVLAAIIAAGTSTATAGTSVANLVTDIGSMFADIAIGEQSRLYFVTNAVLAASLSARLAGSVGWAMTPTGGVLAGVPVVVSSAVPTGDLVLVDASRFAAYSDTITLSSSQQGVLQMETSPDSPAVSSTVVESLFQANKTALRATRYFGIEALTTTAAATTTGMT
jgi:hypothetical protein